MASLFYVLCLVCIPILSAVLIPTLISYATSPYRRAKLPKLSHITMCILLPLILFIIALSLWSAPILTYLQYPVNHGLVMYYKLPHSYEYLQRSFREGYEALSVVFTHAFPFLSYIPLLSDGRYLRHYISSIYPSLNGSVLKAAFVHGFQSVPWFLPIKLNETTLHPSLNVSTLPTVFWEYLKLQNEQYSPIRVQFFLGFNYTMSQYHPNWEEEAASGTARLLKDMNITSFLRMPYLPPQTAKALNDISALLHSHHDKLEFPGDLYNYIPSTRAQLMHQLVMAHMWPIFENVTIHDFENFLTKSATTNEAKRQLRTITEHSLWHLLTNRSELDFIPKKSSQDIVNLDFLNAIWMTFSRILFLVTLFFCVIHGHIVVSSVSQLSHRFNSEFITDHVIFSAWTGAFTAFSSSIPSLLLTAILFFRYSLHLSNFSAFSLVALICVRIPMRAASHACLKLAHLQSTGRRITWVLAIIVDALSVWWIILCFCTMRMILYDVIFSYIVQLVVSLLVLFSMVSAVIVGRIASRCDRHMIHEGDVTNWGVDEETAGIGGALRRNSSGGTLRRRREHSGWRME